MRRVTFCFTGGGINSKVTEVVAFQDDESDAVIDAAFQDWLNETSNAYWDDDAPQDYRQCTHCATKWTGDANICPECGVGMAWRTVSSREPNDKT